MPAAGPILLSNIDRALLEMRMPGTEGLAEALLAGASDAEISRIVYVLHDWFMVNRQRGFETIAKYFDQQREQIDHAIDLFVRNRDELCRPKDLKCGQHPLLQFYLLFDCLVHAGSIKRHARTINYLSSKHRILTAIGVEEFLGRAEHEQIFNYVVVDGKERLVHKGNFHSEAAGGRPVESSGEAALTRAADGTIVSVVINDFSGHYRIAGSEVRMGKIIRDALDKKFAAIPFRPIIYLTHEALARGMP